MSGIPTGTIQWGVRIEGLGTPDGLYRFSSRRPSWDVDNLYLDALTDNPSVALSVDYRRGSSSGQGWTLKVLDNDVTFQIFANHRPRPIGQLVAGEALTSTATTVKTNVSGLDGTVIWWRREAILLGVESGVTAGQYDLCERGHLDTVASAYNGSNGDVDVFAVRNTIKNRTMTLFWWDDETASDYIDEVDVWKFHLRDGQRVGAEYHLSLAGIFALARKARLLPTQWVGEAIEIAGDEERPVVRLVPQVPPGTSAFRFPDALTGLVSEGDETLVEFEDSVFKLVVEDATATPPTFTLDPRAPLFDSEPLDVEDLRSGDLSRRQCREIFTSAADLLRAGEAIGDDEIPLGGEDGLPAVIALQVLTSTAEGTNGPYDTGVDFGLGISAGDLDLDGFLEAQARASDARSFHRFFVGLGRGGGGQPPSALNRVEKELLHPAGLAFSRSSRPGHQGKITLRHLGDSLPVFEEAALFDADNILGNVTEGFGLEEVLEVTQFEYSAAVDNVLRLDMFQQTAQQRSIGTANVESIRGGAVFPRDVAFALALGPMRRWGDAIPPLAWETALSIDLPPGSYGLITHSEVTGDVAGVPVRGVVQSGVVITHQRLDAGRGRFRYRALHTGLGFARQGKIAPSAQILTRAGNTLTITQNHYVPTNHPDLEDDADPFRTDFVVRILDACGAVKMSGLVVVSTTANSVTVDDLDTYAVESGDILDFDVYDDTDLTPDQHKWFVWLAKANGLVGTADDPGYQYEG